VYDKRDCIGTEPTLYSRILVATDGTTASELAAEQAARLAKDQHAQLRIVHVVEQSRLAFAASGPVAIALESVLDALPASMGPDAPL
jgi:nucleotide-binding universal stress UspA family protein